MRRQLFVTVGIVGIALCGGATSVSAHHAFAAEFDANKPVSFKGTMTKMEWVNPHTWLHVDVKKPDGTVENQAKDGSHRANGRDLTFPDGCKLFLGSSGTGAPYESQNDGQKK